MGMAEDAALWMTQFKEDPIIERAYRVLDADYCHTTLTDEGALISAHEMIVDLLEYLGKPYQACHQECQAWFVRNQEQRLAHHYESTKEEVSPEEVDAPE